ncbi:hypothetical protein BASA81_014378 [Batrachochytrium salamandrivorans]|nr:hypothetical protein BASA81_014378 [Batrachochytrium salamandrivorans]
MALINDNSTRRTAGMRKRLKDRFQCLHTPSKVTGWITVMIIQTPSIASPTSLSTALCVAWFNAQSAQSPHGLVVACTSRLPSLASPLRVVAPAPVPVEPSSDRIHFKATVPLTSTNSAIGSPVGAKEHFGCEIQ